MKYCYILALLVLPMQLLAQKDWNDLRKEPARTVAEVTASGVNVDSAYFARQGDNFVSVFDALTDRGYQTSEDTPLDSIVAEIGDNVRTVIVTSNKSFTSLSVGSIPRNINMSFRGDGKMTLTRKALFLGGIESVGLDPIFVNGDSADFPARSIVDAKWWNEIANINADSITVRISGTEELTTNKTFDSSVILDFKGGIIRPESGVTLTINGTIKASLEEQIFDFSAGGSVIIRGNAVRSVEWGGAVGDGVADDSLAIYKITQEDTAWTGQWSLLAKDYNTTLPLEIWSNQGIRGMGRQISQVTYSGPTNTSAFRINGFTEVILKRDVYAENFTLSDTRSVPADTGMTWQYVKDQPRMSGMEVEGFNEIAVFMKHAWNMNIYDNYIEGYLLCDTSFKFISPLGVKLWGNETHAPNPTGTSVGVYATNGDGLSLISNTIEGGFINVTKAVVLDSMFKGGCELINNYIERADTGIVVTGQSSSSRTNNTRITGSRIGGAVDVDIYIDHARNVVVEGIHLQTTVSGIPLYITENAIGVEYSQLILANSNEIVDLQQRPSPKRSQWMFQGLGAAVDTLFAYENLTASTGLNTDTVETMLQFGQYARARVVQLGIRVVVNTVGASGEIEVIMLPNGGTTNSPQRYYLSNNATATGHHDEKTFNIVLGAGADMRSQVIVPSGVGWDVSVYGLERAYMY